MDTGQVISNTRYATKSCLVLFLLLLTSLAQAELPLSIVGTFSGSEIDRTQVGAEILKDKNHGEFDKISSFGKWALFDGRSPAPAFSGSGYPTKEPPFKFSFEDSFGNNGVAFITPQ